MKGWMTSFGSSTGCSLTALCCGGTPAIISLLSAVGLGFMVHDAILIPLLAVFLGINLFATYHSAKRHGRSEVLPITVISALLIFSGIWISPVVLVIGIVGIFLASGLDLFFSKTHQKGCHPSR